MTRTARTRPRSGSNASLWSSVLVEEELAKEDLQPLIELEAVLRQQQSGGSARERRRRGRAPSEAMLARVAVVIDLLVKAGYGEAVAAQLIIRKLLAAGVAPPRQGGDARGWKRLLLCGPI